MTRFVTLALMTFALFSCKKQEEKIGENEFYTCSMDPQVREKKPGNCPICKMELTKTTIDPHQTGIKLSEEQMELANISLSKAAYGEIGTEKVLTAEIVFNENLKTKISSRISGRIERLYFKNLGEVIQKGALLYEVYSEELLAVERDYLLALSQGKQADNESVSYSSLMTAAKNKLLLWGLTEKQIAGLNNEKELSPVIPVYSSSAGIVSSVNVQEGGYVMEGAAVFELSDFSSVWVEAQVYPEELAELSLHDEAEVRVAGYANDPVTGRISFVNPQLVAESKITLVRIEIPNRSSQYRPGMQAYVVLKQKPHKALVVQANAVLQNSKGASIWIRKPDGTFEIRMVETGIQSMDKTEITKGLKEGEEVVTSGAYLLNSEYVFKKGSSPMEGHDMSKM